MAKQTGIIKVRGTVGGITFYKLNGGYYARRKTSLDKERVLRDAVFAGSRRSSALFGTAAKIAKVVYRRLSVQKKGHGVIGKLTAKANELLHEGVVAEEVLEFMLERYAGASAKVLLQRILEDKQVVMCKPEELAVNGTRDFVPFGKGVVRPDCNGISARSG